jgi:hypothetical protein
MSTEAMKLALAALESKDTWGSSIREAKERAITALQEALAQPQQEQEPVAWMTQARNFVHLMEFTEAEAKSYSWKAVYTSPLAQEIVCSTGLCHYRKPLTLDEVWLDDELMKLNAVLGVHMDYFMRVIRAIEAAHKIKGDA